MILSLKIQRVGWIIAFLFFILMAIGDFNAQLQASKWPSVMGRVDYTEGIYVSRPYYSYTIEGEEYKSSRIAYTRVPWLNLYIFTKRYEAGDAVKVYYEPRLHDESILEPGINFVDTFYWLSLFCGLAFFIVNPISALYKSEL